MTAPRLDFLAPGLLGPLPPQLRDHLAQTGRVPATERLLARSSRLRVAAPEGIAPWPSAFPGAGALGLLGAGGRLDDALWYCADPVHLRPDRDRLLAFAGDAVRLDPAEVQAIADAFNGLFRGDGLTVTAIGSRLFLRLVTPARPGPEVASTRELAGRYIDAFLPEGEDGRAWRGLLNETQMLLHGLPFNAAREQAGRLTVNGLWFWGGGYAPHTAPDGVLAGSRTFTGDPVLAGLTLAGGGAAHEPLADDGHLPEGDGHDIVHWAAPDAAITSGDLEGWLAALQRFESHWVPAFTAALASGRRSEIRIHTGGVQGWRCRRGDGRRLWRRVRALAHHLERA